MAWNRLIENIESQIKLNGVGSITGQVLQNVLLDMIAELSSAGSAFGGMVTPEGTYNFNEESKFFVVVKEDGDYSNIGYEGELKKLTVLNWNPDTSAWVADTTLADAIVEINNHLGELDEKVNRAIYNLAGKKYGAFPSETDLPEGNEVGYAFVGEHDPFALYLCDGKGNWENTGVFITGMVGPEGPEGPEGPANTITIGTVETLETGEPAEAEITGDAPNQILNLKLPKGGKGDKGDKGDAGHNPNRGTYLISNYSTDAPTTNILDGDYIVVVDNTVTPETSEIYKWNGTAWITTGRDANMAYFGSGELLLDVDIVNDFTGGEHDVASAETVKMLNEGKLDNQVKEISYSSVSSSSITDTYVSESGIVSSSTAKTYFFPITQGKTYRIKGRFGTTSRYYLYALYNEETHIQSYIQFNHDYSNYEQVEVEVTIPTDGIITHIAIGNYQNRGQGYTTIATCEEKIIVVGKYNQETIDSVGNVSELETIEKETVVGAINELVTSTNKIVDKVDISAGENIVNPNKVTLNVAIPMLSTTGVPVDMGSTTTKVSDFIPIDGNEHISANASTGGNYGSAVYDRNKSFIRTFQGNYVYQEGDDLQGFVRFGFTTFIALNNLKANYGETLTNDPFNPIGGYIKSEERIEQNVIDYNSKENAIGSQYSYGTEDSEIIASPIVDNSNDFYVGYTKTGKKRQFPVSDKIVMMNHDDGNLSDLIGTRKIYNKYGFHANFCVVLYPFYGLTNAKKVIPNGRKLVAEGHDVGLHAVMGCTYWIQNKMFDVTPDGSNTFAPNLSDFTTETTNGKNVFDMNISSLATTKVSTAYSTPGFTEGLPAPSDAQGLWNKTFDGEGAITDAEISIVNGFYSLYGDRFLAHGIKDCDVEDIMTATKVASIDATRLWWLEYWYNNLIDNTLGYSEQSATKEGSTITYKTISERFAVDYDVPSGASADDYYPDASHLLSGKMVYWNDTSNPNYSSAKVKTASDFSDNDYQFVGKFTKGLFKDCFSCCNYEVIDREIAVAQAWFRKFYGIDHFTDQHFHGTTYFNKLYHNSDGNCFYNRQLTVNEDMNGRFYSSRRAAFVSQRTLMAEYGINVIKETQYRARMEYEGQIGNYYGVDKIKAVGCYGGNNNSRFTTDYTDMMSMFGINTASGQENMSYQTFNDFMNGIEDWLKFCYDNADSDMTRGGVTAHVCHYIMIALDRLFASVGTGKVPILSFDTLFASPAIMAAMDILLRAIKKSGFEVVTFEEGMQHILSHPRSTAGNLFPNPSFRQSKWELFGYDNNMTKNRVKIPDGWFANSESVVVDVQEQTMKLTNESNDTIVNMLTRVYGLPAGSYNLSYKAKGDTARSSVKVYPVKNGTRLNAREEAIDNYTVTTEFVTKEIVIDIPEPHTNEIDYSNPESVVCQGCEDNVCAIEIQISIPIGMNIYIKEPKLYAL